MVKLVKIFKTDKTIDIQPVRPLRYMVKYKVRKMLFVILLPAGTSIVFPVGYMNQPTGLLHIYL